MVVARPDRMNGSGDAVGDGLSALHLPGPSGLALPGPASPFRLFGPSARR